MTDERKILYDNYASGFKDIVWEENEDDLRSTWKHYRIKLLPHILKYGTDANILELGCGPGYTLEFLRQQGFNRIKGIDVSKQQIEKALVKNLNVELRDVFEFLKSEDQKYDIIIAFDFIEHFKKEEIHSLFMAITNRLNSKGLLIIRTPNGQGLFSNQIIYGDLTHYTIFNPSSILQILKLHGFDDIYFIENAPIAKNISGLVRLLLWKLFKFIYNVFRIIEQGKVEKIITHDFYSLAIKK